MSTDSTDLKYGRHTADDAEEKISASIVEDFFLALYEVRFAAPLVTLLGVFLAYHLTIAPYHVNVVDRHSPLTMDELALVRPLLSYPEKTAIQHITLHAETLFALLAPSHDRIKVKFHSSVGKHGNHKLPDIFYEGVTFGITSENSHLLEYTAQSTLNIHDLKTDLISMYPKPTSIMKRSAQTNTSHWHEVGYAVYFSYSDLKAQGKLSSDPLQPWKRVNEDMMVIARKYRQVYLTLWYPKEFGQHPDGRLGAAAAASDPHKYKAIVQHVIPSRTGLDEIKSIATVWLSAVNFTAPTISSHVYRQPWTEEELLNLRRSKKRRS